MSNSLSPATPNIYYQPPAPHKTPVFEMFLLIVLLCTIPLISSVNRTLIDQLRWDILEMEEAVKGDLNQDLNHTNLEKEERYLAAKFNDFNEKLQMMPQSLLYGMEVVRSFPQFLNLFTELITIDNLYGKFTDYLGQQLAGQKEHIWMEDMIYDITSNKSGVNKITGKIVQIWENLSKPLVMAGNRGTNCMDQSFQQVTYNLYNILALADLKCYILEQFAVFGNSLMEKEMDNTQQWQKVREQYSNRTLELRTMMKTHIKRDRRVIKCDPQKFVKNKNYAEFTRLLQGFLQNEEDLNPGNTCKKTCDHEDYKNTRDHGCAKKKSDFCRRTSGCNGRIYDCRFVQKKATVCFSKDQSKNRYEYIDWNNGPRYGTYSSNCYSTAANSWSRWFVRCDYCWCLCDEEGRHSDRFVSLRLAMSNVTANRVVTGVRLIKSNRIIKLQIQEGQLLPYGYINQTTVKWKPVPASDPQDTYFTLSYSKRSMLLNHAWTRKAHEIVTGIRFRYRNGILLQETHFSPFDWISGKVGSNGRFISTLFGQSNEIGIPSKDIPILAKTPFEQRNDGYIKFGNTDACRDAAQTTVPFFDTQQVVNQPAVPLHGVGLVYKRYDGYAGFVAPVIRTFSLEHLFHEHIRVFPKTKAADMAIEDVEVVGAS